MEAKIDAKGLNELYLEELVKDCRGTPVEPNMETAHCKDKEEQRYLYKAHVRHGVLILVSQCQLGFNVSFFQDLLPASLPVFVKDKSKVKKICQNRHFYNPLRSSFKWQFSFIWFKSQKKGSTDCTSLSNIHIILWG